jgi:hypothetical protein
MCPGPRGWRRFKPSWRLGQWRVRFISRLKDCESDACVLAFFRCGNAQNILQTIDQQIVKAKSDAAQIRRSNQYHIDQRDAAYTAKLNNLQGVATRARNGPNPTTSMMNRFETPLGSTTSSPRSTFGTTGDDEELTSISKGRKSVSDLSPSHSPPHLATRYPR